ncbi:hypothetical protein BV25DRAFT_1818660 [Artomyces pyxidatus]|uniref:Uncharacterized protein n=1 Tax=Artomyces pyxidatus TaxID=48021 RepID=A0ACB8TIN9_9AGAM|nr:hypothetical protein BV25DRAFT_1818660 [Artomyces pyxidatus]
MENENRKRKASAEDDVKRARQKTMEPPDALLSTVDRSSAPPSGGASSSSQAPSAAMARPQPPPPPRGQPQRRKIEYLPLVRDVESAGGRDLRVIAEEHSRLHTRHVLRDINEWGNIDVEALTMSLRSRIATELSYGLTTLTLLSIMRGQGSSGFPIGNCAELMDEVLDLVEEVAFSEEGDVPDNTEGPKIVTHKELVTAILDDGNQPFAPLAKRQGTKPPELGHKQRPGDIVLAVVNIMRNLSVVPDNYEYLARHNRLLDVMLRLCGIRRQEHGELHAVSPALSLGDLVAVRRDVVYLFINLGGITQLSTSVPLTSAPSPIALRIARRSYELIASFLVEDSEAVTPALLMMQIGVPTVNSKPPPLVDAALEVFTRLAQPDTNRQVIAKAVPRAWLQQLFEALVHRLPISDADFSIVARSESWLSYTEKIIMALYSIAFLSPPSLKLELKQHRRLGLSKLILRLVKRFTLNVPGEQLRAWLGICARRAIEALKVLDDGEDSFDTPQSMGGAPLSFGVGYGEVGEDRVEKGTGLLGGFQDDVVWQIMLQKDVDESMFRELESLARVG